MKSWSNMNNRKNENKKLEIKESLPIMRDTPLLNRNINSAPFYLFDKLSQGIFGSFHGSLFNLVRFFHFKHDLITNS